VFTYSLIVTLLDILVVVILLNLFWYGSLQI